MLRDEPTLQPHYYELPSDPLVKEALVPSFRQATLVRGAFGWFSAGWIGVLAEGLSSFLNRDDALRLEMVVSPELFPAELEALTSPEERRDLAVSKFLKIVDEAGGINASILEKYAIECLAWMYAKGILDLKIAVPYAWTNYHPKIWEFTDGKDTVCVLGSGNATGRSFLAAEHMKVECSWRDRRATMQISGMIDNFFSATNEAISEVIPLTEAATRRLLSMATSERPKPLVGGSKSPEAEVISLPLGEKAFRIPEKLEWMTGLYAHQGEAVDAWERSGRRGILEMATGAGKTITSLIATYRLRQTIGGPLLVLISVPTNALISQWKEECNNFGILAGTPSLMTPDKRREYLGSVATRIQFGDYDSTEVLILTNHMLRNADFQKFAEILGESSSEISILHIGDEAHTLGSGGFLRSPLKAAQYRLGLSATPTRQHDDEGTEGLLEYFGPSIYQFGLKQAIGLCLVGYQYYIHKVYLTAEEQLLYDDLSARIGKAYALENIDLAKRLTILRRAVTESADGKIEAFRDLMESTKPRHLLVYASSKDPKQMELAQKVLDHLDIISTRVTELESRNPKLLKSILRSFEDGDLNVLLAKRVLDEGVDIPATREAVLLASSTIAREWIQRRGRVLRKSPGKEFAVIHDFIALPDPANSNGPGREAMITSEGDRIRAFAADALNTTEVIDDLERMLDDYRE